MTETVVQLGGRDFAIRPLTLGQLRVVLDVVGGLSGKGGGELVEAAARIVQAGLARGEPEMTLDAVLAIEASLDELNAAVAAILRLAGLSPREPAPGEAVPVATGAAGLPGSTPPSPPAAAIPTR